MAKLNIHPILLLLILTIAIVLTYVLKPAPSGVSVQDNDELILKDGLNSVEADSNISADNSNPRKWDKSLDYGSFSEKSEVANEEKKVVATDKEAANIEMEQTFLSIIDRLVLEEDPEKMQELMGDLIRQVAGSEELLIEILERYGNFPSIKEKEILQTLLLESSIAANDSEFIEQYAINMIVNGYSDVQSDWFELIGEIGIRSTQLRIDLLTAMPQIYEEQDLSSAIRSFVPQIVPQQERDQIIYELSGYLDHQSPNIRSAAVASIGLWDSGDSLNAISQGLTDESNEVRHSAATTALLSNAQSIDIKESLLAMMTNEEENEVTRIQAYYALTRYDLQGEDYDNYYLFNEKMAEIVMAQ